VQVNLFAGFIRGTAAKHMPGLKLVSKIATLTTLMGAERQLVVAMFSEIYKQLP
jgi:hypothetical protein